MSIEVTLVCRNIKTLQFPTTCDRRRDSCGFTTVREKMSGFNKPSKPTKLHSLQPLNEVAAVSKSC